VWGMSLAIHLTAVARELPRGRPGIRRPNTHRVNIAARPSKLGYPPATSAPTVEKRSLAEAARYNLDKPPLAR
jgi:hypothetical protein